VEIQAGLSLRLNGNSRIYSGFRCVRPHRPNFFNTKVQGLKGSKIENNRWIAFLWTFDPLNLCVEKSLPYKSHAVEKRYWIGPGTIAHFANLRVTR
jgi:hypothetical protein